MPGTIKANRVGVKLTAQNASEVAEWCGGELYFRAPMWGVFLPNGDLAKRGDLIIQWDKGEFIAMEDKLA